MLSVRRRDSRKESSLIGSFETKYYRSSPRRYPLVAPVGANSNDNTGKKRAEMGKRKKEQLRICVRIAESERIVRSRQMSDTADEVLDRGRPNFLAPKSFL